MSTTQSERYPAKPVGCEGDAGNGGEVSRLIRRGFMTELGGGGVDFMRTECPTSSPRRCRFNGVHAIAEAVRAAVHTLHCSEDRHQLDLLHCTGCDLAWSGNERL